MGEGLAAILSAVRWGVLDAIVTSSSAQRCQKLAHRATYNARLKRVGLHSWDSHGMPYKPIATAWRDNLWRTLGL